MHHAGHLLAPALALAPRPSTPPGVSGGAPSSSHASSTPHKLVKLGSRERFSRPHYPSCLGQCLASLSLRSAVREQLTAESASTSMKGTCTQNRVCASCDQDADATCCRAQTAMTGTWMRAAWRNHGSGGGQSAIVFPASRPDLSLLALPQASRALLDPWDGAGPRVRPLQWKIR